MDDLKGQSGELITLQKRIAVLEAWSKDHTHSNGVGPTIEKAAEKEAKEAAKEPHRFRFSKRSLLRLNGVRPNVVAVMKRAIQITEVDFGITEGVRSAERQRRLVAEGSSWVKVSKHQIAAWDDGFGGAVDVVAFVNGKVSWEWQYYELINEAVQQAAKELGVEIQWGGVWKVRDGVHFQDASKK